MKKMTCYVLILDVNQFKHQAFFPLYDAVSDKGDSELSGSTYGEVLKG